MGTTKPVLSVPLSELLDNPKAVYQAGQTQPIAITSDNQPAAYLIPASLFNAMQAPAVSLLDFVGTLSGQSAMGEPLAAQQAMRNEWT